MYPDDSLFQLGNRRGTGDDYADVEGDKVNTTFPEQIADDSIANNHENYENSFDSSVETNGTSPTATNDPAANITQEMNRAEAPNGENGTNEQRNQDLFVKSKDDSSPPPQTEVQTPVILVEMLDFELTLTFTEPQRRLLRSCSNSQRHRQAQSRARYDIVKNTLTKYFTDFYLEETSSSIYSPLDQVVFNNDEGERVIVSKSSVTGKLYDLASTSVWSGLTLFRKTDELQRPPSKFMVQAIQLQALGDESGILFSALREADTGDVAGLDRLESVKASLLLPSPYLPADTNGIIGGGTLAVDFVDSLADQTNARQPQIAEIDEAVSVALIIASVSFALLAIALLVAYRRSEQAASPLHAPTNTTRGENEMNDWKVQDARPDEIPTAYTSNSGLNTIASSASPTHGIQINTDGDDADDEMSLPGAELPVSVHPSGGASVSAFSDVSSLGTVIQDAIKAYQNNVGNHLTSPESQGTFFHRFATGRDEEESVGVASIDDSSQLGALSLAG